MGHPLGFAERDDCHVEHGLFGERCQNGRMATLPSGTVTFVFTDIET